MAGENRGRKQDVLIDLGEDQAEREVSSRVGLDQ